MAQTTRMIFDTMDSGACCTSISVGLQDGVIASVEFQGGCYGNHQGIQQLVKGRAAGEVISLLEGIQCQNNTSCPDQLAKAIRKALGS